MFELVLWTSRGIVPAEVDIFVCPTTSRAELGELLLIPTLLDELQVITLLVVASLYIEKSVELTIPVPIL